MPVKKVKGYKGQKVSIIQVKYDGYCLELSRGEAWFRSRKENIWDKLPDHIKRLAADRTVLGELHCPGTQATSIITLLNEQSPELVFTPFAVPSISDWAAAEKWLKENGFSPAETIVLPEPTSLSYDEYVAKAEEREIEGFVVKEGENWYKIKPEKTVDCIVTGYTLSESLSFFGGLKAIQVSAYVDGKLKQIASVGSGFTADYRMEVKPDSLIGKVAEISYDSIAVDKLKFPRFERWRPDKPRKDCIL